MPEPTGSTGSKGPDVEKIKSALVSSGILKSTSLSEQDQTKVREALLKEGVDLRPIRGHLICNSNFCIVVRAV